MRMSCVSRRAYGIALFARALFLTFEVMLVTSLSSAKMFTRLKGESEWARDRCVLLKVLQFLILRLQIAGLDRFSDKERLLRHLK